MAISSKDVKKGKDLVEKLLLIKGKTYNKWLHEKQQEFIEENQDLILEALSVLTDDDEKDKVQKEGV